jgi:hypothetical protein
VSVGYAEFLRDIKTRVQTAQIRAALAVNKELVPLSSGIGRDILQRQTEQGWGTKVIDRLAADLRRELPEMTGLSPRNLKYVRSFAEAWPGFRSMNWRLNAADGSRRSDGRFSPRSPISCRRDNCPNGPIAGNSFTGIPPPQHSMETRLCP